MAKKGVFGRIVFRPDRHAVFDTPRGSRVKLYFWPVGQGIFHRPDNALQNCGIRLYFGKINCLLKTEGMTVFPSSFT